MSTKGSLMGTDRECASNSKQFSDEVRQPKNSTPNKRFASYFRSYYMQCLCKWQKLKNLRHWNYFLHPYVFIDISQSYVGESGESWAAGEVETISVSESVGQTNRRNHLFFAYLHTEAVCAHHYQTASFSGRQLQRYRGGVKK